MSMFTFPFSVSEPLLLIGLIGIFIPVLIHLFNRSRGRLVHIGSIELIRQVKKNHVSEIKISQWLLLLLRLLLIILVTLIIANVYYLSKMPNSHTTLIVTPGWLKSASTAEQLQLNLRISDDITVKTLTTQTPIAIAQENKTNNHSHNNGPIDTWTLLADYLSHINENENIEIYAGSSLSEYGVLKPNLNLSHLAKPIKWHFSNNPSNQKITQTSIDVLIYVDKQHKHQSNLFVAALQSIKKTRLPQLNIEVTSAINRSFADVDWIFYFTEQSLIPNATLQQCKTCKVLSIDVLQSYFKQRNNRFSFENIEFPSLLLNLLLLDIQPSDRLNNAVLSDSQIVLTSHAPIVNSIKSDEQTIKKQSLNQWLAILLVICWCLERWMSEKNRGRNAI